MKIFLILVPVLLVLSSSDAFASATLATGTAPEIPWFRIILSFLLSILFAILAIFLLRAYHARSGGGVATLFSAKERRNGRRIEIIEMRRINTHVDLCVVHFGGDEVLLSVARDGAAILIRNILPGDLADVKENGEAE